MKRIILAALVGVLISGAAKEAEAASVKFIGQFIIKYCDKNQGLTPTTEYVAFFDMCMGYIEGLKNGAIWITSPWKASCLG